MQKPGPPRERSILELASMHWDKKRRNAFVACYRIMRAVDDIVDNRRKRGMPIPRTERKAIERTITDMIRKGAVFDPRSECRELLVPSWPWRHWLRAMRYDLVKGCFPTYRAFLSYAEGAAVAPGAIFMHLCALRSGERLRSPRFNVRRASRPLALFCYHVHILRDMKEDARDGIVFVPDDMLREHGLDREGFIGALRTRTLSESIRHIARFYHDRGTEYRKASFAMLESISAMVEERYRMSLKTLFDLYAEIHDRMDVARGCFTADLLQRSRPDRKKKN
ncbi:MAG: squalene/phytoene synthase family protein [Spirochaetota bacterium]